MRESGGWVFKLKQSVPRLMTSISYLLCSSALGFHQPCCTVTQTTKSPRERVEWGSGKGGD